MSRKRSLSRRQLDDSSSDDDDFDTLAAAVIIDTIANHKKKLGGSVKGHRMLYRDREGGYERMLQDYLAVNPTYGPEIFRRRLMFFDFILSCCLCSYIIAVVRL